jgi:hypothetical protein
VTDALGQVKTYSYAKDDRPLGLAYTASVHTTPNVSFAYDPYFPRLVSMTDGTGTTTYAARQQRHHLGLRCAGPPQLPHGRRRRRRDLRLRHDRPPDGPYP